MTARPMLALAFVLACGSEPAPSGDRATGGSSAAAGGGGFGGRGGDGGEGCLEDIAADPAHCGACDQPCAPEQVCDRGVCVCEAIADPPSFSLEIAPLLGSPGCTKSKCHAPPSPAVSLDLSMAHPELVGVLSVECGSQGRLRVAPGAPHESYLVDKLLGVRLCSGSSMPPSGPLAPEQVALISRWICAGAKND